MSTDMEYEELLRTAFKCGRRGDPFGLANADVYVHGIGSKDKHRLVFGISAALKKVAFQMDPDDLDFKHELMNLDAKLWIEQTDENIDETIARARTLFESKRI
jgi:hypothetical protein